MTTDTVDDANGTPGSVPPRGRYHHGDLRAALVQATITLIETRGLDHVSVREAAKLVGVSPGAPFRHFPSRLALLNAVAEEAQERLGADIERALAAADGGNAIERFHAIGRGFLTWAINHPTHFQVISNRSIITYESDPLRGSNDRIRRTMRALIEEAAAQGLLRPGNLEAYEIGARALVYGLARMYVDGQFPSWGLPSDDPIKTCNAILDQYFTSIRA